MNRKDLVENVARQAELTATQAEAAVGAVIDGVVGAVAAGDKVSLSGFGTFEPRHRAARSGRNPQTGEALEIAATVAPAFKPASAFKQAVAEG
ncbi:HU family DNA-binding protein [Nocardioides coralli]|uniref:HU family DNA-binding protein n=1 Tax=Nocardioides coralli TaxID=2872154 RepID=UPI001CA46574|nr:HU family DNA-binding protein [Nocardioides coralli]QZY30115.1 HU family DNA-binding protein [Nocardioides coralli]